MGEPERIEADVAVVGAGAAGLFAALTAARSGARVALVSATPLARTASYWAQGGLAAALAVDDSPDLHREDTERAGRDLVRSSAAAVLCRDAPRTVRQLERLGVHFDADRHGNLALGLEGGHSRRRVVHAGGSATGRRVVRELSAVVAQTPGIAIIEGARAAGLWTVDGRCVGAVCEDGRAVHARGVVLATGGSAALWQRTTNPPGSLGIGLLLAHAAGAALADLEFMQFHPTAVTGVKGREGFLVTEAIRGEGAVLLDASGERFVDELAPRDEVARAIWDQMTSTGAPSVALDMRAVDPQLFPNVVTALQDAGVDPTRDVVPVAPAAHYGMGGIVADLDGATTVPGLYAVGESACTGLHGANRLASNSLSECFVFGARAALAALAEPREAAGEPPAAQALEPPTAETRAALWRHAGLVRDAEGLAALARDPHPLAALIARHALLRTESRGAHWRSDHPATDPALDLHHSVTRDAVSGPAFERWD
ncbi:MAG: L-aspartate oxidase [Solirubrobacteraceae bacterium]|jgi:L-aspartate oxidase|nr:L-aspartate oxidase [Solirubrobacteraceae bacterium]